MSNNYTTDTLISNLRIRGTIPNNQQEFPDANIITFAQMEMTNTLIPAILKTEEKYYIDFIDYEIVAQPQYTGNTPPPNITYAIPSNAMGGKLDEVMFVDNDGNLTSVPPLDLPKVGGQYTAYYQFLGYYILDNNIILYPQYQQQGTLRLYYFSRPNQLDSTTNAGQVTSINTSLNSLTLSNIPANWAVGTELTVIGNYQPFNPTIQDTSIVTLSSPTITLPSVTGIEVGDWVCNNGYTVIPQVAYEGFGVLEQCVLVRLLEANGDYQGMAAAKADRDELIDNFMQHYISNRVDESAKIITTNGRGIGDYNSINPRRLF